MTLYLETDKFLNKAIIQVVAFFDLFEYPVTAYEIWNNLDKPSGREGVSLEDVLELLERMVADNLNGTGSAIIAERDGFYFLVGRAAVVNTRRQRHNYSARKIAIARRFARVFSWLPFVQVIAIANSLGFYNLRDGSDIDFFIITASRRLWLSRLYCTGLAKILNSRPNAQTKRDKICLSFYISTEHLNLTDLRLPGRDPYFDYWRRNLFLLYNKRNSYEQFLAANKLSGREDILAKPDNGTDGLASEFTPSEKSWINWLERGAKYWQLKIMPRELQAAMNNSDGVVINDAVLKLYQRDRRREFLEKYGKTLNEIFKEGA